MNIMLYRNYKELDHTSPLSDLRFGRQISELVKGIYVWATQNRSRNAQI